MRKKVEKLSFLTSKISIEHTLKSLFQVPDFESQIREQMLVPDIL